MGLEDSFDSKWHFYCCLVVHMAGQLALDNINRRLTWSTCGMSLSLNVGQFVYKVKILPTTWWFLHNLSFMIIERSYTYKIHMSIMVKM